MGGGCEGGQVGGKVIARFIGQQSYLDFVPIVMRNHASQWEDILSDLRPEPKLRDTDY